MTRATGIIWGSGPLADVMLTAGLTGALVLLLIGAQSCGWAPQPAHAMAQRPYEVYSIGYGCLYVVTSPSGVAAVTTPSIGLNHTCS